MSTEGRLSDTAHPRACARRVVLAPDPDLVLRPDREAAGARCDAPMRLSPQVEDGLPESNR